MKKISLQNFERIENKLEKVIKTRINSVLKRKMFILGEEVKKFEEAFKEYIGAKFCIGVGNGTQALELALIALDVKSKVVFTVANAGMYSTIAILSAGGVPYYIDVKDGKWTMDANHLKNELEKIRPAAVIITHLYGQTCEMASICEICEKNNIALIEDCSQAHGAIYKEKKVGTFGLAGCFSFYPTKNLGAYGDAGALITNNSDFAEQLYALRQYGWRKQKYFSEISGGRNTRMDEIQAAVLNAKLPYLDKWNQRRKEIAYFYNESFRNYFEYLPFKDNDCIVHHYTLISNKRKKFMDLLRNNFIECDIHFPKPDYKQTSIKNQFKNYRLKVTEKVCNQIFTIPCHPYLADSEVEYIAKTTVQISQILKFN